jgi:hypothetical protein
VYGLALNILVPVSISVGLAAVIDATNLGEDSANDHIFIIQAIVEEIGLHYAV